MSLATLAGIKTAALDELDRSDLSSYANDFVTLAEDLFNHGGTVPGAGVVLSPLRHRKMVISTDITPSSNVYALPSDYLQAVRVVEKASTRRELKAISPAVADQMYPTQSAGLACDYAIVGSNLTAFPLSSNDIELTYYQKIPTLISNDPNWLLTESPSAYLRGIELMALIFINETDSARFRSVLMALQMALGGLNTQSDLSLYSNISMRVAGPTP